jgi:penicillin-binding protein 2
MAGRPPLEAWDSIQLAIGQKDLLVTPLQMARFYALIANGGRLVEPHIAADVEEVSNRQAPGRVLHSFAPPPAPIVKLDPLYLDVVRQGLLQATHGPSGTSTAVFGTFPVPIAGKTGTAEKSASIPGFTGSSISRGGAGMRRQTRRRSQSAP